MDHVWPWWFFAELMRWKVGWKRGWIEWVKWVGLMMSWRVWKEVTRFDWIRLKIGFWEYENRQFIVRKIINILYHYGYFLKKLNDSRKKMFEKEIRFDYNTFFQSATRHPSFWSLIDFTRNRTRSNETRWKID